MSNFTQLVSRPIKNGCNFNAVGNPIVYHLRRQDYDYQQINDDAGFAQIQINGTDVTAYFEEDDLVYIQGFGTATITASAFSGGNTLLTVNLPFTSSDNGYVNNLSKRTDYAVEVEIFDADTDEALGPRLSFTPLTNGDVKADISGIVRNFLAANWSQPSGTAVEADTFKRIYIVYQEFYNTTFWEPIDDSANTIVAVFAVMHLIQGAPPDFSRYPHGGNMLSFMPADDERKWMTKFVSPSVWREWPFTMSFLWPATLPTMSIATTLYDSEGTEITSANNPMTPTVNAIHRVDLSGVGDEARTRTVSLRDGDDTVTETITLKVKDPCDNPVMLFWKNSRGGDSFWLFDETQDYQCKSSSGRNVRRLTLFADNLAADEWSGINELNSTTEEIRSNIVDYGMDDSIDKTSFRNDNQVFIINQDGSKVGVMVINNDNETRTGFRKNAIEITIELPEYFTL